MSNQTRRDFRQGDIIAAPMRVENIDPEILATSQELRFTDAGPAFSKRRMMVVFHVYHDHMECLPLYTNGLKGLAGKPERQRAEWVPVVSKDSKRDLASDSTARHLVAGLSGKGQKFKEQSHVHFTQSVQVYCAGDVVKVGKCDWDSFQKLHVLRFELNKKAQGGPW
jgi:hypothetical protein